MTKIGVLSDTHDRFDATRLAIRIFENQGVSALLHCGDVVSEEMISLFNTIPTHFVFGNMDRASFAIQRAAQSAGHTHHDWFGEIEIDEKKIAFLHGHHEDRLEQARHSQKWDLICFGHTHQVLLTLFGKTLLLNPGGFTRVAIPSVSIVDLPTMEVERFAVQ
ncbi:MAG: YfcE family phosphodiesterase [Thermoguttaceae bacterium]